VEGATYSHYVVRVPQRETTMREMENKGVQLGQLIEYSIPDMPAYKCFANGVQMANSLRCSTEAINLPIWGGKSLAIRVDKIFKTMEGG
jgi:hypothetical protein